MDSLGWWTISDEALLDSLRRCRQGEDPDMVYAELYANSEMEIVDGSEEDDQGGG